MPDDLELKLSPRWFTVTLPVFPPIPMVQASALALATKLGSQLSLTDIHMADEVWEYRRPSATEGQPHGLILVTVKESEIKIEHRFPATGLEQFERLVGQVISAFDAQFAPQMVFGPSIEIEYIVDSGTDARVGLLEGLGLVEDDGDGNARLDAFDRPCHKIGLRLGFPAFVYAPEDKPAESAAPPSEEGSVESKKVEGADWQALVTLLTLGEDPKKMCVEVTANWPSPTPWDDIQTILVERIGITSDFLRTKVLNFLKNYRGPENVDE